MRILVCNYNVITGTSYSLMSVSKDYKANRGTKPSASFLNRLKTNSKDAK